MKIISVVGARPNFMKIAPFIRAIETYNKHQSSIRDGSANALIEHTLVHTGQHYDDRMSKAFFKALSIPDADINLGVGSGSHAEQVGQTMMRFEQVLDKINPDWVVVVGDVNATLACSVTAKKQLVNVCHIEAGLRSRDMAMPEEINRLVTDRLSDLLLTPDKLSSENLRKEGTPENHIVFVGNIMIDTLEYNRKKAEDLDVDGIVRKNLLFSGSAPIHTHKQQYALMTMHRPSNVDQREVLTPLVNFLLDEVASEMPLIWPIHPRTEKQLMEFGLWQKVTQNAGVILLHPLGYHEMLRLNMDAHIMLTDSGGLQEECTVLGTPCLTLRWNTERPITLREYGGASVLVGNNVERIREEYRNTLKLGRKPQRPELWDGNTAMRCVDAIVNYSLT
jgi:UDP-N-acetylglucosamine 2-epimerase (non-hydrolysing)